MTLISKTKEPGEIVASSSPEKFRNQVRVAFPDLKYRTYELSAPIFRSVATREYFTLAMD